jgi:putative membrane protein
MKRFGDLSGKLATIMSGESAERQQLNAPTQIGERAEQRDYLAAERTLLAWIRTGLALMGFGFVVARFGFFLQQLQISQRTAPIAVYGLSLWFGTALIGASVAVNVLSALHHLQLVRSLNPTGTDRLHSTILAVSTALFLALVGLAMAIYLISVRSSP